MLEREETITTRDGAMDCFICQPEEGGPHPAVILYMDAPGIREELRDMARRLGTVGYYVILPNLYYRVGREGAYGFDLARIREDDAVRRRHAGAALRTAADANWRDILDVLWDQSGCDKSAPGGDESRLHSAAMAGPAAATMERAR